MAINSIFNIKAPNTNGVPVTPKKCWLGITYHYILALMYPIVWKHWDRRAINSVALQQQQLREKWGIIWPSIFFLFLLFFWMLHHSQEEDILWTNWWPPWWYHYVKRSFALASLDDVLLRRWPLVSPKKQKMKILFPLIFPFESWMKDISQFATFDVRSGGFLQVPLITKMILKEEEKDQLCKNRRWQQFVACGPTTFG